MARDQAHTLLDPIRRLIGAEGGSALTDAELLERFVATADATSFEVLVWRHGAMVLGLCRRVLRDLHEAEDAFQATFLVFARKAGSIGQREVVGCWLPGWRHRYAFASPSTATRPHRRTRNRAACPEPTEDADWRDVRPVLDEEIARLPEVPCAWCRHISKTARARKKRPFNSVVPRGPFFHGWLAGGNGSERGSPVGEWHNRSEPDPDFVPERGIGSGSDRADPFDHQYVVRIPPGGSSERFIPPQLPRSPMECCEP